SESPVRRPASAYSWRGGRRLDDAAGRDLLYAVDDHAIAGDEAGVDQPEIAAPRAGLHVARDDGVARADEVHELAPESLLHRALRHGERARPREAFEAHAHELARQQPMIRILELRPELLRPAGRVE